MKKSLLFVAVLLCGCQAEPLPTATLLQEGNFSTEFPEFASSINEEQTEFYFNRTTTDRSSMWIMVSDYSNGEWSEPEQLPFTKGDYVDVDPFVTSNGRLFFSSNRPSLYDTTGYIFNTWYADQTETGWTEPVMAAPPLNSDSTEIFISMAKNGNAYYLSERQTRVIVRSVFSNGSYGEPEAIRLKLRGEEIYASNPCIANDESFLITAVRDPQGNDRPDLFVSFRKEDQWSDLINLGPAVNTEFAEFAPGLSKDDQVLYFTSERPGLVGPQEEGVRPPGDLYSIEISALLRSLNPESYQ